MSNRIQILDWTLRDGGLGLEDSKKNKISSMQFDLDSVNDIIDKLAKSKVDIIELGSIEISEENKVGYAIYNDIESISQKIPPKYTRNQMYAALYRGPDTPIENIPVWSSEYCEAVRVIIRYSELKKSLDFCKALANKGYKVFIQPMLTMRYSEIEIQMVIDAANAMNAYAVYFVDSYGYMHENDVIRFFKRFDGSLDDSIKIGFHAHNNMNLAFANALTFIKQESDRKIIVDACIAGMGQGAGNLQTEIIIEHMIKNYGYEYNFTSILEACEVIEKYVANNLWGYSVTRFLPAIHKTAYKYAIALRDIYGLDFKEIDYVLKSMPDNLRHRYTPENTLEILRIAGYE